jgi:hypothetical protein
MTHASSSSLRDSWLVEKLLCVGALVLPAALACAEEVPQDEATTEQVVTHEAALSASLRARITDLQRNYSGAELQDEVLAWAHGLRSKIGVNKASDKSALRNVCAFAQPKYVLDGVDDCYGYVQQVWNPILSSGSPNAFYYFRQNANFATPSIRASWANTNGDASYLPRVDAGWSSQSYRPNADWAPFSSGAELYRGDVLSTHQGHFGGTDWHGGLYAGSEWKTGYTAHYQLDSNRATTCGSVSYRALNAQSKPFAYYYKPLHCALNPSRPRGAIWCQ